MKAKTLGLMTLCILSLVFVIGLGSADLTLDLLTSPSVVAGDSVTVTFNLSATAENYTALNWSKSSADMDATWKTLPSLPSIDQDDSEILSATLSVPLTATGDINAVIDLQNGTTSGDQLTFLITVIPAPEEVRFCALTADDDNLMELEIEEITVTGFGEEDDEWVPLDEVEVEVRIENTEKDYKLEDVEISWGLYNLVTGEWVLDEEESDFNIKDGDEKTLYFTFKLEDPDEFENDDTYAFYVWAQAFPEIIEDEVNNKVCRVVSEDINVIVDSDFLVLDNLQIEGIDLENMEYPTEVSCGTTLHLTGDIWNIGDSNQEEIEIRIYNYDLGIDELLKIGDVDSFDSESISFEFTIPEGIEEKWYELEFTIQEDGDVFENDYVDEDAVFNVLLDVKGNCALPKALVSAALDEGGKAGRELIIRSTITNTGTKSTSYLVSAVGYSEWASSANVDLSTLILEAGQSADVLITLDVNKDVSGERLFNIEVLSEGELVVSQPLSVSIEKALIGDIFGDNGVLTALIIGIAIVLIIIIIVLAIRVARR